MRGFRVDKSWIFVARTVWGTNEHRVMRPNPAVVFIATRLCVGVLSQATATLSRIARSASLFWPDSDQRGIALIETKSMHRPLRQNSGGVRWISGW